MWRITYKVNDILGFDMQLYIIIVQLKDKANFSKKINWNYKEMSTRRCAWLPGIIIGFDLAFSGKSMA